MWINILDISSTKNNVLNRATDHNPIKAATEAATIITRHAIKSPNLIVSPVHTLLSNPYYPEDISFAGD
jgi:hypothetical protein